MTTFKKILIIIGLLGLGELVYANAHNPYTEDAVKFNMVTIPVLTTSGSASIEILKSKPKVIFKKWNNEVQMGVSYKKLQATGNKKALTNRIEWKGTNEEVHAFPLTAKAGMEDGGFEIEVVLKKKPTTNIFEFQIDGYENLNFWYQGDLTPQDIAERRRRPDNVVGSYAVYHKTKKNHQLGETNYATGKAYHIYRPKAIDANGVEVWGQLNFNEATGILSVTVPQLFLDTATYPVIVDPTFGKTTIGASNDYNGGTSSRVNVTKYNLPDANASVTKVTAYIGVTADNMKGVIYNDSAGAPNARQVFASTGSAVSATQSWVDSAVTVTLASSGNYWIGFVCDTCLSEIAYDDPGTGTNMYFDTGAAYYTSGPPDPFSLNNERSRQNSVYATYTVAGGGGGGSTGDLIIFE